MLYEELIDGTVVLRCEIHNRLLHGKCQSFTASGKKIDCVYYEEGERADEEHSAKYDNVAAIISNPVYTCKKHNVEIISKTKDTAIVLDYYTECQTNSIIRQKGFELHGDSYHEGEFVGTYVNGVPIGRHEHYFEDEYDGYTIYENGVPVEFDRMTRVAGGIYSRETYQRFGSRKKRCV